MSKYLRCHEIYKEMILEITKQSVIVIYMWNVWVLDVKIVANEMSGPFTKVGAQQADNDSGKPLEFFHKNVFLDKSFDWNSLYSYLTSLCLINRYKTYKKHVCVILTRSTVLESSNSPPL